MALRAGGAAEERALPSARLRDLLAQVPSRLLAGVLPERIRGHVEERGGGLVGLAASDELRSDLAAAWLATCSQENGRRAA